MKGNPYQDVTFGIKTFMRPHKLNRLIGSIRTYYPEARICVADDSNPITPRNDIIYYSLPFDSGLSFGRNYLVRHTSTKYYLTLDDDHVFCANTNIEKLVAILENSDVDIIAGVICEDGKLFRQGGGIMELKEGKLFKHRKYYEQFSLAYDEEVLTYQTVDYCANFFLARTNKLLASLWDENLKMEEHNDFFLKAKGILKVAFCPSVYIDHYPSRDDDYMRFRKRGSILQDYFKEKYCIEGIQRSNDWKVFYDTPRLLETQLRPRKADEA
jgi:glycosyltransferase involved in cell wall biosynthesis